MSSSIWVSVVVKEEARRAHNQWARKITDGFLWKADWVASRKWECLLCFLLSLTMPSPKCYLMSGRLLKKNFFFHWKNRVWF